MWILSCFVVTCLVLTTTTVSGADEVQRHKLHSSDSATDEPKLSEVCGIASGAEPPTGNFESNAWPWIVSVRVAYNKDFHCGGTLIAPQAVFTAAHCVKTEDKEEEAKDVVVFLGTTDATKTDGNHVVVSPVSNIYYYHGYRPKTLENNIALLILETPVSFNEFIRPACIWPNPNVSPGLDEIVNREGYIATWTGESGVPAEAKIVTSRVTEERNCGRYFVSSRSFCAENTGNTTFCNEDLGQGLLYKRNGRWTLRGVLSVFREHLDRCERALYVLYSDASPMWWWLRATLRDKLGYNIET